MIKKVKTIKKVRKTHTKKLLSPATLIVGVSVVKEEPKSLYDIFFFEQFSLCYSG